MEVVFKKSALKELGKLEKRLAQRVFDKIMLLGDNPYPQGNQKMENEEGYRIRVGDYRAVYVVDKENKEIVIIRIKHRGEVYKKSK